MRQQYRVRLKLLFIFVSIICVWGVGISTPLAYSDDSILIVGTSAIQFAVRDLTGMDSELAVVIPPDVCPGHFDLKPGDLYKFNNAKIIILHLWQKELPAIKSLFKHITPSEEKIKYITVSGSWLVPKNYISALEEIGKGLIQLNLLSPEQFYKRVEQRKKEISIFEQKILLEVQKYQPDKIPILCSLFQKEFLTWLGFHVVGEFPRGEEITLAKWGELLDKGKSYQVKIVVENLQSGEVEMVRRLTHELGAKSAVLSNFPGACTSCNTWENSVKHNVNLLLQLLH